MKKRTFVMIFLAFLLFASLMAFRLAGVAGAQETGRAPSSVYLASGTISGGDYQVHSYDRPVSSAGEGYFLLGPASLTLRGSGCCCTYLPCMMKGP